MTPESPPDPIAVAVAITEVLDRLGIAYVIGGSLASSVHGEPRSTNDVDIVVDLRMEAARDLIEATRHQYYVSETAVRRAIRSGGSFNLIHQAAAVKVDVFVAGDDAFEQERLARRVSVSVSAEGTADLFLDTAEHSILRKLEWYRRGGETSQRQWLDVVAMLRIQRDRLDWDYCVRWAAKLGVVDLLERARGEAGLA